MKVQNLSKIIDQKEILRDIQFELTIGEIVGLVGRNGSGKTTLFRTLNSHYLADSGEIILQGTNLLEDPQYKNELFFIDEKENFFNPYSLKKIAAFYQLSYPKFDLDFFTKLIHAYQLPLNRSYQRLSKGMQKLFLLILAMSSKATYIFLDEPFDGLDVLVKKQMIELLLDAVGNQPISILISSHQLNELEPIIDRVMLLSQHTITQDYQLEALREHARKLQLVFKGKEIPEIVKQNSKAISIQGRVIVALFENYSDELAEKIKALAPLVMEELPIQLTDVFEANLRNEKI
ncbi:MAG TPA: ABC transporter ATP-binding protein [Enterococcus columbae]|nr:ABC transporter ATP-binding protein [Enterococcus columbae]